VTTSSASYGRWAVATVETPIGHKTRVGGRAERGDARRPFHKRLGLLDDALMLLLVIWLFPLVILLVGAPVALLVRLLLKSRIGCDPYVDSAQPDVRRSDMVRCRGTGGVVVAADRP
jgi:hypothetical protein